MIVMIALHRAGIDAKALGNAAHAFTGELTLVQSCLDLLLKFGSYPTSAKPFSLVLDPPKAGADSFCDHCPLKLSGQAPCSRGDQ